MLRYARNVGRNTVGTNSGMEQIQAMKNEKRLREEVERQAERMRRAEKERPTLLAQTVYITTLGLVLVLPVIGGAYLGSWLDRLAAGYSIRWTVSLIFLGLVLGGFNVYFLIRGGSSSV